MKIYKYKRLFRRTVTELEAKSWWIPYYHLGMCSRHQGIKVHWWNNLVIWHNHIVTDLDLTNCSNSRSRWLFLATQCRHQSQLWWSKWTCSSQWFLVEHICSTIIGHTKRNAPLYVSRAVFTKATIEYAYKPFGSKGNMKLHTLQFYSPNETVQRVWTEQMKPWKPTEIFWNKSNDPVKEI